MDGSPSILLFGPSVVSVLQCEHFQAGAVSMHQYIRGLQVQLPTLGADFVLLFPLYSSSLPAPLLLSVGLRLLPPRATGCCPDRRSLDEPNDMPDHSYAKRKKPQG